MDAIILDGDQRPALAVTRSLGKRGIRIAVGAETLPALSSCSRYCARSFSYPSPYRDPDKFLDALRDYTKSCPESLLLPMTDVTLTEILVNRREFPDHMTIPFVDHGTYMEVTDKINLVRIGRKLNIPLPASFLSTEYEDRECLIESVRKSGFPVVVKPSTSKIRTGKGWVNAGVRYASDEEALRTILSHGVFKEFPFLVQEKIEGPGFGIFLLMKKGNVLARFAHRRIREKPPSGGVSVLCESTEPPAEALRASVKVLSSLRWTGVAMVEFKLDREQNVAKMLEVNARFWGSLQLAISCGVDFPYLLYRLANGDPLDVSNGYAIGMKSRWELGDLDHLFIRLLKNPSRLNLPLNHPTRMSLLKDFLLDSFHPSVKNEVFHFDDLRPFLFEISEYFKYFVQSKRNLEHAISS